MSLQHVNKLIIHSLKHYVLQNCDLIITYDLTDQSCSVNIYSFTELVWCTFNYNTLKQCVVCSPVLVCGLHLFITLSINERNNASAFIFKAEELLILTLSPTFNAARHFSFAQLAYCFAEIKEAPHCRHFSSCQKCILLQQSAAR